MTEEKLKFKVIVLGDRNVGKTCLTYRFCENEFLEGVCSTIGVDFRKKTVDVGRKCITLQIWDTAGQERFRHSVTEYFFRNVDAVVFVYSVTDHNSLLNLHSWIEACKDHDLTPDTVPCIIVGNKCDEKEKRTVSMQSAMMFADAHLMPVFETSAKADSECNNVKSIFETVAYKLANQEKKETPTEGGIVLKEFPVPKEESSWCCLF